MVEPTAGAEVSVELAEASGLQQFEVVWVWPEQFQLPGYPEGFGLEVVDFLGPGDRDHRGQGTVWVRGPVLDAAVVSSGVRLVRGEPVTLPIPHDQPRAWRTGGQVLPPPSLDRAVGAVAGGSVTGEQG
jgi:hypothetical protein